MRVVAVACAALGAAVVIAAVKPLGVLFDPSAALRAGRSGAPGLMATIHF
jgi:hypothetical protein